jgi:ATP-dependent RNA helicase DeaD
MGMAMRYQKNPKLVKIAQTESSSANIEQFYYEIKERAKPEALTNLINEYKLKFSLVFCNTKRQVDEVVRNLNDKGYFANGLHGDMRQSQRDRVMNSFRRGETEILVATDVAARGIDMNIEAVFNYDVPEAAESYLHRIGRTGRAGQTGKAFTFVVGSQIHKLNTIKRYSKGQIHNSKLPV